MVGSFQIFQRSHTHTLIQAPEPKTSRRRGRPANASTSASQNRPEEYEADVEEPAPKRRGPSKKNANEIAENATVEEPARGRRARRSLDGVDAQTTEQVAKPRRKRGRAAKETNDEPESIQEHTRSRSPKNPKPAPRKRGRKTAQQDEPAPENRRQPDEEDHQSPRQSPRNSLRDLAPVDAHNKGAKAARSKRKAKKSEVHEDDAPAKKRRRGERDGSAVVASRDAAKEPSKSKRRRRSKDDAPASGDEDSSPPSPPKPYLHVASQKRLIRTSTINAKWSPLSGSSLPSVSSILTLAHAPILQRTSTTRNRRALASSALNLVARRVTRKLARGMPFPPASSGKRGADADGGRAAELDFENVLDERAALERQLGPGLHAVELLRAEKVRMERELESSYETLRNLETRAREQTRERRGLYRKAHVLAPTSKIPAHDGDRSITAPDNTGSLKVCRPANQTSRNSS